MEVLVNGFDVQSKVGELADRLEKDYAGKDLLLCCILKGAAYFTVDLSRALFARGVDHCVYFLEASSYVHQTQSEHVSITREIVPEKFEGKHVLVLDELFDNGRTLCSVKLLLMQTLGESVKSIKTCVMFRKNKKHCKFPPADYVGFDAIPDVWLCGYGLDDDGRSRGSLALWTKK